LNVQIKMLFHKSFSKIKIVGTFIGINIKL